MKSKLFALLLALAALVAIGYPPAVRAQEEVSFDFFYDSLKPYGEWVEAPDYGLVWHPSDVDDDWAPYTDGYWAYTDSGWTWVSYEEFGGLVYHYGRWIRLEDEGWCWVPDYDWGPAWVSWRNNDDYVGWAPLPPEARYVPETGISTWVDTSYDIGPGYYRFCRTDDFGAPVIREVLLPRERNVVIVRNTVNITNISVNHFGRPFLGGLRFDYISGRVHRPIPTLKLVQETNVNNIVINNFNGGGNRGGRNAIIGGVQRGNTLVLPAPAIRRPQNQQAVLSTYKPAKVLPARAVSRGWDIVKAPEERQQLKEKFQQDVKGATPQNAPAKAFSEADIKKVPVKADLNAVNPAVTGRRVVPGAGRNPANSAANDNQPGNGNQPGATGRPGTGGFVNPRNPNGNPGMVAPGTPAGKGGRRVPGAAADQDGPAATPFVRPGNTKRPGAVAPVTPNDAADDNQPKRGQGGFTRPNPTPMVIPRSQPVDPTPNDDTPNRTNRGPDRVPNRVPEGRKSGAVDNDNGAAERMAAQQRAAQAERMANQQNAARQAQIQANQQNAARQAQAQAAQQNNARQAQAQAAQQRAAQAAQADRAREVNAAREANVARMRQQQQSQQPVVNQPRVQPGAANPNLPANRKKDKDKDKDND